jgi:hypothetical protein
MYYTCALCDAQWPTLPQGAIAVNPSSKKRTSRLYRFPDGTVHEIKTIKEKNNDNEN